MAFTSGSKILSTDYNQLVSDLNEIFGTGTGDKGYGGNTIEVPVTNLLTVPTPPPFDSSTIVDNEDWLTLRAALEDTGNHQGSVPTLPSESDLEDGDIIQAFNTFETAIIQVTTNSKDVDGVNTIVTNSVLSSIRNADWSNQIKHTFTVDYGSDDSARHFFNTGGQIRLTMEGPNDDDGHQWGNLYSTAGTFIFDTDSYFALSSTINNSVDLTVSNIGASVYSFDGLGAGNTWTISARFIAGTSTNGARGSKIEISSISTDVYAGNPAFPGSPDIVMGTFTSTIGERRSVTFFNRPQPTYTTVVSLADGT